MTPFLYEFWQDGVFVSKGVVEAVSREHAIAQGRDETGVDDEAEALAWPLPSVPVAA